MIPPPKPDLRSLLATGQTIFNAWLTLGLSYSVEVAVEAGWQAVSIDQQHALGGHVELLACVAAAKGGGVPALVRVAQLDFGAIGKALDAGAQGVIVPMIEDGQQAAAVVEAVKYPPLGNRSHGPYRARMMVDGDYFKQANGWTIAGVQIETRQAVENLDDILAVPGLDLIYLGPNDLAISMSDGRERNLRAPEVLEAIEMTRRKAAERGIFTSIFANDADYARLMAGHGWQLISIGTDGGWLAASAKSWLDSARAVSA
jgi:4-hydroxy-2-oxoheptanedioate aldolase